DKVEPGCGYLGERRQQRRRDQPEPRDKLPSEREQHERRVADQCSHHALRSALIASSRTRPHSSSTLSSLCLTRKMPFSFLTKRVSTIALMRPGRADITATRSAR